MKRTLLVCAAVIGGLMASAQCVPNALYQDSVFGAWPDTTENFTGGVVNVFYSDTLNLLVPQDAGLIDPQYSGFTIDSVALAGVDNMPPGVSIICNSQTNAPCTFITGQVGCGLLEGTPTQEGTYDLTVNVTAYALVFGFVVPVPYAFNGYRIVVAANSVGVNDPRPLELGAVRNSPNPFATRTTIEFGLNRAGLAKVRVFDLVGAELWKQNVDAKQGANSVAFDAGELGSGIYLYQVEAGGKSFTGRMVVNR